MAAQTPKILFYLPPAADNTCEKKFGLPPLRSFDLVNTRAITDLTGLHTVLIPLPRYQKKVKKNAVLHLIGRERGAISLDQSQNVKTPKQ